MNDGRLVILFGPRDHPKNSVHDRLQDVTRTARSSMSTDTFTTFSAFGKGLIRWVSSWYFSNVFTRLWNSPSKVAERRWISITHGILIFGIFRKETSTATSPSTALRFAPRPLYIQRLAQIPADYLEFNKGVIILKELVHLGKGALRNNPIKYVEVGFS